MRLSINHKISYPILDLKGKMRKRMRRIRGGFAELILSIGMYGPKSLVKSRAGYPSDCEHLRSPYSSNLDHKLQAGITAAGKHVTYYGFPETTLLCTRPEN